MSHSLLGVASDWSRRVFHLYCKRTSYFYEHVEDPDDRVLKLVYIVRGPRGASYALLRTADHPELLFAVNLHGFLHRTPFDGVLFKVEDGKLVIADADCE